MNRLAIVVVAYNSAHVILELLESVPLALDGLSADIVVVDNGSSDETAAVLANRSDCRLVVSGNVGYAGGINLGVKSSTASGPILVLNPDVRLLPGSVSTMVTALSQPDVGIVAPKILNTDGTVFRSLRRKPSILRAIGLNSTELPLLSEYVSEDEVYGRHHTVDWALGAVLLLSRRCYEDLNGWDASYFLYSEETDFCLRARDQGWKTYYTPDAAVIHIGGQSGQNAKTHVMQIINKVRLYRRRHSALAGLVYYLLTVLSEASWVMRGHSQSVEAIRALLRPSSRPVELAAGARLIPS